MKIAITLPTNAKFPLGRVVSTPGALQACGRSILASAYCAMFKATGALSVLMMLPRTNYRSSRVFVFFRPIRSIPRTPAKVISGSLPRPIAVLRRFCCQASTEEMRGAASPVPLSLLQNGGRVRSQLSTLFGPVPAYIDRRKRWRSTTPNA